MPKSDGHKPSGTSEDSTVELDLSNNHHHPILCSFPSGVPDHNHSNAQFQLRGEGSTANLVGKDEACHYKASNNSKTSKRRTKFVVGVWNANTKKLRLQPTLHDGSVFTMTQSVPNYQSSISSNLNGTAEQYRALFQDFGSAKKQKAIRSQEANRVSVDSVVGGGKLKLSNMKMSASNQQRFAERQAAADDNDEAPMSTSMSAIQEANDQWRRSFLPTFDETAKHASHVYRLSHMAGPGVMDHLRRIVDICQTKPDVAQALMHGQEWKPSLTSVLDKIIVAQSKHMARQLQSLLLMHMWSALYGVLCQKRFVSAHSSGRLYGQPGVVSERFLELFATETARPNGEVKYTMTQANKDGCLVYLLILYCLASSSGHAVSGTHLENCAKDLQLEISKDSHSFTWEVRQ